MYILLTAGIVALVGIVYQLYDWYNYRELGPKTLEEVLGEPR